MKAIRLVLLTLLIPLTAGLAAADSGMTPINHEVVNIFKIEGTVWSGSEDFGQRCTFRYLKGGILNYTTPTGTFQNGTWKQRGANVYMEMNNKYAEYRGVFQGNRIVGKASNIKGLHWNWDVKPEKEAGK